MSGPSERIGRAPSSTASSTISTARSTPKQKPYSSASRTSMFVLSCRAGSCVGRGLPLALRAPLFSHLISPGDAVIGPLNLPIYQATNLVKYGLVEIATCVREVPGQDSVCKVTDLAQTIP